MPLSLALRVGLDLFLGAENNNNTLHTNPNRNIVQDITNSTYNMIILKNITKGTYIENETRKNLYKTK